MTGSELFAWSAALLVGLGAWILAGQGLSFLYDLGAGLGSWLRRLLRPRLAGWLSQFQGESQPGVARGMQISPNLALSRLLDQPLAWLLAALVGTALVHDRMLSAVILASGIVLGEVIRSERSQARRNRLNEDASRLIVQFESRFPLLRSIMQTLEKSMESLPEGELRVVVKRCIFNLRLGKTFPEAMQELERLPVASLGQLAAVLCAAQQSSPEVFAESLQMLRREVEDRLLLHSQVRQSLTLLRGTVRLLQVVLFLAMLAVSCLPAWRSYFTAGAAGYVKLLLALTAGVISSLFVEVEMRLLEA